MNRLLLFSSIKSGFWRLALIASAVTVGIIMVLSFVMGGSAIINRESHMTPISLSNADYEPRDGVAPLYIYTDGTTSLSNELGVPLPPVEIYEMASPQCGQAGLECVEIPELPTPSDGQYYLSAGLADYFASAEGKTDDEALAAKMFHESLGSDYLGLAPWNYTVSPDTKVAYKHITPEHLEELKSTNLALYSIGSSSDVPSSESVGIRAILTALILIGALGLLFPVLLFVGIASQLGAKQKEKKYATLRLIGVTKGQISQLIVIETLLTALIGLALGFAIFIPIRLQILKSFTFSGTHFWAQDCTFSPIQVGVIILGTLLSVSFINLFSMRKAQISPLGVAKNSTLSKHPRSWRLAVLLIPIVLMIYSVQYSKTNTDASSIFFFGFALTLIGILLSGPWLTWIASRLFAKFTNNAIVFLGTMRINLYASKTFRAVGGVVLAVFVSEFFITVISVLNRVKDVGVEVITLVNELQALVYIGLGITVFVAVISLVVSTYGSLLERKRSMATLHLAGMTLGQLRKLVLLESLIPMVVVTVFSAVLGAGAGVAMMSGPMNSYSNLVSVMPGAAGYICLVLTIVAATIAICAILPSLKSLVDTESNRDE
jgi:ABC-type antimicrobial peptide transport system permease subunit